MKVIRLESMSQIIFKIYVNNSYNFFIIRCAHNEKLVSKSEIFEHKRAEI